MPGIFKKFSANDIKITPFEAHKTYSNTDLSSLGASADFVYWSPYNKSFYTDGNRKYSQIDKLYYRDYIRERAYRLELDDATYTTQERRLYGYANVISLSQKTFGSEVQPSTFILSCSYSSSEEQFDIRDDGFGNLYDKNKGRDNFPNEDYRILYIGPTQAFKRADLTIDYETGNKYVNNPFSDSYIRTVYDDSYFLNEVEFNNVNFTTNNSSSFYDVKTNSIIGGATSSIIIPHQPQFNFEPEDDFTITFYYDVTDTDNTQSTLSREYFILTKEGTKSVPILPSEGTQHTPLSQSGSAKIGTAPVGNQFPYRIYYKGNTPSVNQASIFFERSDGETIQFVSASIFGITSTGKRFVSCKNDNGVLKIKVDNNDEFTSTQQNSPTLNKTVSNKANITLYNKPQPDGSYTNYIGSGSGAISQLMIWNQALPTAEITNVSESITGTYKVGNIFYDNGFAVITHPSYYDVLRTYDIATRNNETITSLPNSGTCSGLRFNNDGTKLIISDNNPIDSTISSSINIYNLSTAYDTSTILNVNESVAFNVFGYDGGFQDLYFSPDGYKMFTLTIEPPYDNITEYILTGSFDPGSYSNYKRLILDDTHNPFGMDFSPDGHKMFLLGSDSTIYQYNLKRSFDLSIVENVESTSLPLGGSTALLGLKFSPDGYKLFTVSNSSNQIDYYILKEPFNIFSIEYINSFSLPTTLKTPMAIEFNPEGTKLYIIDSQGNDAIHEWNLSRDIQKVEYKNTHLITENEYQCTMTEDEFEFTTNISARKIPFSQNEDIANFATGSNFKPYITSVGLYDDDGNLLVTGKLGQPIKASSETDTTFVVRYDT